MCRDEQNAAYLDELYAPSTADVTSLHFSAFHVKNLATTHTEGTRYE